MSLRGAVLCWFASVLQAASPQFVNSLCAGARRFREPPRRVTVDVLEIAQIPIGSLIYESTSANKPY